MDEHSDEISSEKRYFDEECNEDFCVKDHYCDRLEETEMLSGNAITSYLQYLSDRIEELEKQIKNLRSKHK